MNPSQQYSHGNNLSRSGVTTGLVAVATLIAIYMPGIKKMPAELTVPAITCILNFAKNILLHHFKFLRRG